MHTSHATTFEFLSQFQADLTEGWSLKDAFITLARLRKQAGRRDTGGKVTYGVSVALLDTKEFIQSSNHKYIWN